MARWMVWTILTQHDFKLCCSQPECNKKNLRFFFQRGSQLDFDPCSNPINLKITFSYFIFVPCNAMTSGDDIEITDQSPSTKSTNRIFVLSKRTGSVQGSYPRKFVMSSGIPIHDSSHTVAVGYPTT